MGQRSVAFWVDAGVKTALIGLLAVGAFSGLHQFEGKAFGWRLVSYPLAAFIVPACWYLAGRKPPYPYAADILLTLPFLVDVAGNALNLYDSISWWDDANHFVNWALLCAGVGQLLLRTGAGPAVAFCLVTGFGAVTAILWELAEYFTFIRHSGELATAYTDTLGDLTLGLLGSVVAGLFTAASARRRRAAAPTAAG